MNDLTIIGNYIQNNSATFAGLDYEESALVFNETTMVPNPVPAPLVDKSLTLEDVESALAPLTALADIEELETILHRQDIKNSVVSRVGVLPVALTLEDAVDQLEESLGSVTTSITNLRDLIANPPQIPDPNWPTTVQSTPLWQTLTLAGPVTVFEIQDVLTVP